MSSKKCPICGHQIANGKFAMKTVWPPPALCSCNPHLKAALEVGKELVKKGISLSDALLAYRRGEEYEPK